MLDAALAYTNMLPFIAFTQPIESSALSVSYLVKKDGVCGRGSRSKAETFCSHHAAFKDKTSTLLDLLIPYLKLSFSTGLSLARRS